MNQVWARGSRFKVEKNQRAGLNPACGFEAPSLELLSLGSYRVISDNMLLENCGVRFQVSGVGCQGKEMLDTET
jgi:hypothetical protein